MIHQLKLQKKWFEDKIEGRKPWELRLNDRNFAVGDYLGENEIDEDGKQTGRFVVEKITNIVYPEDVPGGLEKGYVIMTVEPCIIQTTSELKNDMLIGALSNGMNSVPCEPPSVYAVYG